MRPPAALAWAVAALVLSRLLAYWCFPVFDDAFITYRYGASLAAGHGLVYNSGQTVLGTTTPVFALLSAGLWALGMLPDQLVPFLNIGLDVAIVLLAWRFVFQRALPASIAFAALFGLSPMLGRVCVGGMEADFFVLQTLAALILYARGHRHAAAVLAAASYFTRPEGVVTVMVLIGAGLWERRLGRAAFSGLVAAAVAAPGLLAIYLVYGHVLPQSLAAKGLHAYVPPLTTLRLLLAPEPVAALIAALAALGTVPSLRAGGVRRLAACWLWLYVGAYLYGGPHIWSWYSFPPLALAALIAAPPVARWAAPWVARLPIVSIPAGIVTAWCAVALAAGPDRITRNVYRPVATFCRDVQPADTLLAYDIGIVGYHCPADIIDGAGLVTPDALAYGSVASLIQQRHPTYLFLNQSGALDDMMRQAWFTARYTPLRRFSADGATAVYHGAGWRQDYVVFRSKGQGAALDPLRASP